MKDWLKSLFIGVFPVLALMASIVAIWQFVRTGFSFSYYLGLFIVSISILAFFGKLSIKPVARTKANPILYSVGVGIGVVVVVVLLITVEKDIAILWLTMVLALGWLLYLKWYSVYDNRSANDKLQVGKVLPSFQLEDAKANTIDSSSFLGNPTIYLFYRGNWCPLCMAQIKEITAQYKELEKLKVNTVLVSPQPHKYTEQLAKKYKLNFNFLVDTKNRVAQQLGIMAKNGLPMGFQALGYDSDSVMPTVLITDRTGKLLFVDLTDNYRVRPEPETFLKVLENNAAA